MSTATIHVPDLLRRLAAAPYSARAVVRNHQLTVQTNDPTLLAALQNLSTNSNVCGPSASLEVRVIRDEEAPSDGEDITILSAWPLTTLLVGSGTVLIMDAERREILGFLASPVTATQFVHELLPMVLEYLHSEAAWLAPTVRANLR